MAAGRSSQAGQTIRLTDSPRCECEGRGRGGPLALELPSILMGKDGGGAGEDGGGAGEDGGVAGQDGGGAR